MPAPVRDRQIVQSGLLSLSERLRAAPAPRVEWVSDPWQVPPPWEDDGWDVWAYIAGRGSGKTATGAHYIDELLTEHRWQARIIAPTIRDAKECVVGPVGLLSVNPDLKWRQNDLVVLWPNGSRLRLYGAYTPEDVERLRAGGNSHVDWYEEMATWVKLEETIEMATLGLRLGHHPRSLVTTTPKPREALKGFLYQLDTDGKIVEPWPNVRISTATTEQNKHLAKVVRDKFYREYAGSRLGEQELEGKFLEQLEGALWNEGMIEPYRVDEPPVLVQTVVWVDPAKTNQMGSDETGIVVVGRGVDNRGYVLADHSGHYGPKQWADVAVDLALEWGAYIVGESNIAGDLVAENVRAVLRERGLIGKVRVETRRSKQSKENRAQPAVTLYEQGRISHVGYLARLESQQFTFTGERGRKDDRVDALTGGLIELALNREFGQSRGWRVIS